MSNMVYVMCGIAGSGKSTVAEKLSEWTDGVIVSSDGIREYIYGDESIQGNPAEVFNVFYYEATHLFDKGFNVILDATNLTVKDRKRIFMEFGDDAKIVAIVIPTPLKTALKRNSLRDRVVPSEVIVKQSNKFKIPTRDEGFFAVLEWKE